MTFKLKTALAALASLPLAMGLATPLMAQDYPNRPITLIVPYAPGGVADLLGRSFAEYARRELGQPVVVENMPGANGNIGWNTLAQAEPDGYTIGIGASTIVMNKFLYAALPYDVDTDIVGIAPIGDSPQIYFIDANIPATTLEEFVAYAQDNPTSFASAGLGGVVHLAGNQMATTFGMDMAHLPYQGVGPAITDIIGGHVSAISVSIGPAQSALDGGYLRPLAVLSNERLSYLPDVPTTAELGHPMDMASWFGIMGPAGMEAGQIDLINRLVREMLKDPETLERIKGSQLRLMDMSSEDYAAFLKEQSVFWESLIAASGIDPIE